MSVETVRPVRQRPQSSCSNSDENFCYWCGENRHFAVKCPNAENQSNAIQKLIQSKKKNQVVGQKLQSNAVASNVTALAKKSAVDIERAPNVPKGLIGAPSCEPVKVNGHMSTALLDSGSQVTIIFKGWYKKHLSDVPIHPADGLDIWGLSESSYPYRGYVVVEMEFLQKVTGAPETISVLALIYSTPRGPEQTPIIVGTNAKANLPKRLARLYREAVGVNLAQTGATQTMNATAGDGPKPESPSTEEDDGVGCVKWIGPSPLVLPPGTTCQVNGKVEFTQPTEKEILMLDASPTKPLPAGVLLTSIVVPRYAVDPNQFTIQLYNELRKEATIPVGSLLGHLYSTDVLITIRNPEHVSVELDDNQINFGDSPLPEEWKERLCKKLVHRADVFSLHE